MSAKPPPVFSDRAEMMIPPLPWDRPRFRPGGDELVVLLHGLGRSWHAMEPLGRRLGAEGFSTLNLPYPSHRKSVAEIVSRIHEQVAASAGGRPVHFVTHSLGGIVARMLLAENPPWKSGRLVMLGTPNGGSEIIDWASGKFLLRRFLKPAARSLATETLSAILPALPRELEAMVIMGRRPTIPFFRKILQAENDGIVSVERGRTDGLRDFAVVDADHTFIQIHPEAVRRTIAFLKGISAPPVSSTNP